MKVTVPSGNTTTVPVSWLVTGSTTGTGVGPAGYTAVEPGSVKLVTLAVLPAGATELPSTLSVRGPVPATRVGVSLASVRKALTLKLTGTAAVWPSVLTTAATSVGTGPVKPGAGLKVYVPSGCTSSVPVRAPVVGS